MKNLGQVTDNQDIVRKQDIPVDTNQLTNNAGFITSSAIIGKVDKIASTDNAIARFDGTNGAIQNSKVTIDDSGVIYSDGNEVALTSDLTNMVKTTTNNTFTANNIFKNNAFEIRANSSSDDSWIKLTNATDSGYYAFGIRRPYDMYGLQMKIHPDTGNDQYIDILHAENYTKYAVPKTRTINNQALSSNITLTASDVGALPSSTTIPTLLSQLSDDATHRTVTDSEKETWNSKSSFSGSYTDLTDKPTIPTVNNPTLMIQRNGETIIRFSANQSNSVLGNIIVPDIYYGTCETDAATAAKVVSCENFSSLETGAYIIVRFTYANSALAPSLIVNATGVKRIRYRTATALSTAPWKAGDTLAFRYDGTYWALIGNLDTNTTYTLSSFGVTATSTELNYCDGVTSNIQTQLDAKAESSAIPTTTSQLTNDSGFITTSSLGNYLPLSGGTLTGSLTVTESAATTSVTISEGNITASGTITCTACIVEDVEFYTTEPGIDITY